MAILIFLTPKVSLLFLNLNKELKLIFLTHDVNDIWKSVIEKKENYSAIVPHLFLLQISTEW